MLKNHIQQIRKILQYRNSRIPQDKHSDKAILQTPPMSTSCVFWASLETNFIRKTCIFQCGAKLRRIESVAKPKRKQLAANTNQNSKQITGSRRGKMGATKSRLVLILVFLLIAWESGASFSNQLPCEVKQSKAKPKQTRITFDTQQHRVALNVSHFYQWLWLSEKNILELQITEWKCEWSSQLWTLVKQ